jgi:CDP-glucose 4,6-dehydratase
MLDIGFWAGRRVFLTGHTGFKGSWLTLMLRKLGAQVAGLALPPNTSPNLFDLVSAADGIEHQIGDITSLPEVEAMFTRHRPEIVLHLAAQSLVQESYRNPVATYATNVIGTVHVLDAARRCDSVRAIVVVSSDKCYENQEWVWAYRETDRLGGHDPYSNSKSCAELVTDSYRWSFFHPARYAEHGVAIGSARAGNVIGGGDWAADRLVPDAARAFSAGTPLVIRNPAATRPWQHVIDPLIGYLLLAQRLCSDGPEFGGGWNFGPDDGGNASVAHLATTLSEAWGLSARWQPAAAEAPSEAMALRLDAAKARALLGWRPLLRLDDAIKLTAEWYRAWREGADLRQLTDCQLDALLSAAAAAGQEGL